MTVRQVEVNWDVDRQCMVAEVILFKTSGKYCTTEYWRIPAGALGPADMANSPDARRIDAFGVVLVPEQEPWGYPCILGDFGKPPLP